jgi:hypothetical protein
MTRKISVNLTDTIETWRQATNSMSTYVGEPDLLLTTNKADIVSAINEIAPQVTTATIRSLQTLASGGTGSHTTLVYDSNSGAWQFNCNTISQSDLGPLSTSAITSGVFPVARIPNISANKTTSGVFNKARIPHIQNLDGQLADSQVGFVSDDVPEGTSHIYYTDSLARSALSGGPYIAYSQLTGVIQTTVIIPEDLSQLGDNLGLMSLTLPRIYVDSAEPQFYNEGTFWYDDVRNTIQIRNAAGVGGNAWAKIGHIDSGGANLNILDSTNVTKILAGDSAVNIGRLTIQDSSVWTAGTSTLETLVSPYNITKLVAGAGGVDSAAIEGMIDSAYVSARSGGGAAASRTTGQVVTGSIAANIDADIEITSAPKAYMLLRAQVSATSWLRIYTSAAARTADASRNQFTDPAPNSGVLAEILHPTSAGGASGWINFAPAVPAWNESSSTTIYMAIRNLPTTGSNTITVDLEYLPLEA